MVGTKSAAILMESMVCCGKFTAKPQRRQKRVMATRSVARENVRGIQSLYAG